MFYDVAYDAVIYLPYENGILEKLMISFLDTWISCFIVIGFRMWVGRAEFWVPGERCFAHLLHPPSRCPGLSAPAAVAAASAEGQVRGLCSRSSPLGEG